MKRAKILLTFIIPATFIAVFYQNCSVPFESNIESSSKNSYGLNSPPENSSNDNDEFQFPEENSGDPVSNPSGGNNFVLPKTGPVVYLYQSSGTVMVKDICLSDNNYILKIRNAGSNPKLCLTKQSGSSVCMDPSDSFVAVDQVGYVKNGTDWIKDNVGHSLRQLILPSKAPMTLAVFYVDDNNRVPKQVGSFTVHACADKIIYNHISFSCPTEDICPSYFPETTMEPGSCVQTTGGVRISCLPSYVESGSPRSGSFLKYPEPAAIGSSTGNTGGSGSTGGSQQPGGGGNTGSGVGAGNTMPPAIPIGSECGNSSGVTISSFKSDRGYTETGTVAPGTVMSFPFVIDSVNYPNGIKISYESGFSSGSYNRKDFSISKCPGQFQDLPAGCVQINKTAGALNTDPLKESITLCKVEYGVTYYLNIRPTFSGQDAAAVVVVRQR